MASADSLTCRLDALADALREAGVSPDHVARILGSAAEATMHALVLDAVLDERHELPEPAHETPVRPEDERATAEPPVRLAA